MQPLADAAPPAIPHTGLFARIEAALDGPTVAAPDANVVALHHSVRRWRVTAAGDRRRGGRPRRGGRIRPHPAGRAFGVRRRADGGRRQPGLRRHGRRRQGHHVAPPGGERRRAGRQELRALGDRPQRAAAFARRGGAGKPVAGAERGRPPPTSPSPSRWNKRAAPPTARRRAPSSSRARWSRRRSSRPRAPQSASPTAPRKRGSIRSLIRKGRRFLPRETGEGDRRRRWRGAAASQRRNAKRPRRHSGVVAAPVHREAGRAGEDPTECYIFGRSTLSMTWMTPFDWLTSGDCHQRRVAIGVPHPDLAVLLREGQRAAGNGLPRGLAAALLDRGLDVGG